MRKLCVALLAALPVAAALAQAGDAAAGPGEPSAAERLVFLHEHLANVRRPGALRYAYVEDAEGRARVTDAAVLTLSAGAGGRCCDVHGDYLSGPLAVVLPDIPDARANPVLLYFLEGEVRRLQRTTRGQSAHFRRRMRQAFADGATVEETTATWRAQAVPARTVRVAPFLTDPYRGRFPEEASTEYLFVFSDAVPGGVLRMEAVRPGAAPARRTLSLEEGSP